MAGEAAVAVGLGALAEEEYWTQRVNELIHLYRRLQELRRRILQEVEEKAGEDVAEIVSNIATAIQRYATEIEEALAELKRLGVDLVKASLESAVEEYAEVLRLDIPVGGGKTLEDLLYESRDEVLDKLHEIMIALYMEYVEINETCDRWCPPEAAQKLEKLATLELATYIIYKLFQRQKIDKKTAVVALNEIVDKILSE
jgi:phosphoglycolate phosphatase-like HAD superfamily hydrolase